MARKPDEKFDMTRDEIERLAEAFKKEEFRKLFAEYAEEISNPESRKKYEEDIAELERERGVDVKFVHPHPGYVLRTCADGAKKAFVNVAQNDAIEKASFDRRASNGAPGMHWNIPHSFAPPREDRDKSGAKCAVFDVVFHPDTIRMALSNAAFRRAIDSTALDGVEEQFGVRLDRSNVKTMKKLKFKGKPTATVIRKRKENVAPPPPPQAGGDGAAAADDDPLGRLPYPYDDAAAAAAPRPSQQQKKQGKEPAASAAAPPGSARATAGGGVSGAAAAAAEYAVPKYTIVNQYQADISDFACNLASGGASATATGNRPRALVVDVSLPLLGSAAGVTLDVLERKLSLRSDAPARYALDLPLPYAVDEAAGSAKFDKRRRCLVVTLPLLAPAKPHLAATADGGSDDGSSGIAIAPMTPPVDAASLAVGAGVAAPVDGGDGHDVLSNGQRPDLGCAAAAGDSPTPGMLAGRHASPILGDEHGRAAASTACVAGAAASCERATACAEGSWRAPAASGRSGDAASARAADGAASSGDSAVLDAAGGSSQRQQQQHDKPAGAAAAALDTGHSNGGSDVALTSVQHAGRAAAGQLPDADQAAPLGCCPEPAAAAATTAVASASSASVKYIAPPFNYDQEDSTVTFVIDVPNIKRDSFRIAVTPEPAAAAAAIALSPGSPAGVGCAAGGCGDGEARSGGGGFVATFRSVGSGHFPMHYSLAVRFPAGCVLERDLVDVDVSARNAVLVLHKASGCAGSWPQFWSGSSPEEVAEDTAEVKQFVTQETLQAELDELDKRCQAARQTEAAATAAFTKATTLSLDVKSLQDECLSINITELDVAHPATSAAGATADGEEDDITTLPSPEIIYTKEPPKDLQGILKKNASSSSCQTVSESSDGPDDVIGQSVSEQARARSASGGSSEGADESLESSDENNAAALKQRKKAVTFNDHVDETAYQPTAAVTMLHQTLKNKRKRQKKKEDRKHHAVVVAEGRRRRRNSSSGSITTDEEDAVAAAMVAAARGNSSSGSSSSTKTSGTGNAASRRSQRSAAVAPAATPAATPAAYCNGSHVRDHADSTSSDIDLLLADVSADGSTSDATATVVDVTITVDNGCKPGVAGDISIATADAAKKAVPTDRGTPNGPLGQNRSAGEHGLNVSGRQPSPGIKVGSGEREPCHIDSDDDDTSRPPDRGDGRPAKGEGLPFNEHATKCLFDFRNSIIYELDE